MANFVYFMIKVELGKIIKWVKNCKIEKNLVELAVDCGGALKNLDFWHHYYVIIKSMFNEFCVLHEPYKNLGVYAVNRRKNPFRAQLARSNNHLKPN